MVQVGVRNVTLDTTMTLHFACLERACHDLDKHVVVQFISSMAQRCRRNIRLYLSCKLVLVIQVGVHDGKTSLHLGHCTLPT